MSTCLRTGRPADLDALGDTSLGIYAFSNGGCTDDGASSRLYLLEMMVAADPRIRPAVIMNSGLLVDRPTDCSLCTDAEWEFQTKAFDRLGADY